VPETHKLVQLVGAQGRILITSRSRLPLVQAKNYRLVHLELPALDNEQGRKLLETMLERSFTEDEKQDVERILQIIGCLPLALVLVASLAISPHISIARLANQLESHPLNALTIAGPQPSPETSVCVSLEITYAYLLEYHPQAAAAFVALGIFTRPQSTIQILRHALLADQSTQEQDRIISLLNFHHLITQTELDGVAVWQMHPLLHELAKEYLHKDPSLSEKLQHQFVNATIVALAQLRDDFQHNRPVGRIFDFIKADIFEISIGLLHDGQIIVALNMLENASALLIDAGHLVEYQSWMEHLTAQLQSVDLPAEPIKMAVANFVNLHTGSVYASLNDWDRARERWRAVDFTRVREPEIRQVVLGQVVKARSLEVIVLSRQGMLETAQMVLEDAQREFRGLGVDEVQQPEWQEALIDWFIVRGDLQPANQAAQMALALYQDGDNRVKMIQIQKTIADILLMDKDYESAEVELRQLLEAEIASLSIKAELHINLALVLLQTQKPQDALSQLGQAEEILDSFPEGTFPDSFARLWSYRTWGSEQLGKMKQAIDQAHKSLYYWRKLPNSETSQQTIMDMILRIEKELMKDNPKLPY